MFLLCFFMMMTISQALPIISTPHPDMTLSAAEICSKYGFIYAIYEVTTTDGYILRIARISGQLSENEPKRSGVGKPPILL